MSKSEVLQLSNYLRLFGKLKYEWDKKETKSAVISNSSRLHTILRQFEFMLISWTNSKNEDKELPKDILKTDTFPRIVEIIEWSYDELLRVIWELIQKNVIIEDVWWNGIIIERKVASFIDAGYHVMNIKHVMEAWLHRVAVRNVKKWVMEMRRHICDINEKLSPSNNIALSETSSLYPINEIQQQLKMIQLRQNSNSKNPEFEYVNQNRKSAIIE